MSLMRGQGFFGPIFQNHSLIVFLVFGAIKQGDWALAKSIGHHLQKFGGSRILLQLGPVLLAEYFHFGWVVAEGLAHPC